MLNKSAIFNQKQELKITLPTSPSVKKKPIVKKQIQIKVNKSLEVKNDINDFLNFVDESKLYPGRPKFNVESYFLDDLKNLSRKLGFYKNVESKKYFVDKIKNEYEKYFHNQNNLIEDIKKLNKNEIRQFNIINILFNKHNISQFYKDKLLPSIKQLIKDYSTSEDLHKIIIYEIEKTWISKKLKYKNKK